MRALPLVLALTLLPLLPVASASPVADEGCTHVGALVHACAWENGNGDPCAEVWISRQTPVVDACVPLSALVGEVCVGRVCVYETDQGLCVGGQVSHAPFEECVGAIQLATSAGEAACTHVDPSVHVCLWRDDDGDLCADLVVERRPVLDDACVGPGGAEASSGYPCVYYTSSTFVCRTTGSQGETCVTGEVGGRPFGHCLSPRAGVASATYPCVFLTEDVWACYEAGCVFGMYGHYPYEVCLPPATVETVEPCLPGELACVEREGSRVCVTYRTGDLEDPRRACYG